MICFNSSAIFILSSDGTKKAFDPEQLQSKILSSCIQAGMKDPWLAEDLTNAVESALTFQAEKGIELSENEINSYISRILEDAGYSKIASIFRNGNKDDGKTGLSGDEIKSLLERHFGLKDAELLSVSRKVTSACTKISSGNVPLPLILELARFYKTTEAGTSEITPPGINNISASPFILSGKYIRTLLSDKANDLIDLNIVGIDGISRLFPAIKLRLSLERLASHYRLEPLITELSLYPCIGLMTDTLNEIVSAVVNYLPELKEAVNAKKYPVYLKFDDIYIFSQKYFGIKLPEGEKFCRELAAGFAENLDFPVILKGLRAKA